jgi:hypothetical protein
VESRKPLARVSFAPSELNHFYVPFPRLASFDFAQDGLHSFAALRLGWCFALLDCSSERHTREMTVAEALALRSDLQKAGGPSLPRSLPQGGKSQKPLA